MTTHIINPIPLISQSTDKNIDFFNIKKQVEDEKKSQKE